MTDPTDSREQERKDFEAWADKRGLSLRPSPSLTYYSSFTAIAEEAWQAAMARAEGVRAKTIEECAKACRNQIDESLGERWAGSSAQQCEIAIRQLAIAAQGGAEK